MSSCECDSPTNIRITSEVGTFHTGGETKLGAMIRCNQCGGKHGFIDPNALHDVPDVKGETVTIALDYHDRPERFKEQWSTEESTDG